MSKGVAAKAGCVHLMFSMDQKLDWEGPENTHNSTNLCLKDHLSQPTVHCPPEVHKQSRSCHYTKTHSVCSHKSPPPHTHTTAHLTSCVGRATPPCHKLACISLLSLTQAIAYSLINCKGLTFGLLTHPPKQLVGSKVTRDRDTPTSCPCASGAEHSPRKCHAQQEATPIYTNCTQVLGHAHKLD